MIVGAMKAGSTTLMNYLRSHPEVGIPYKEVNYFSNDSRYSKGIKWYSKWFENYSSKKMIGEKTPGYSSNPKAVKRIYDLNPDMKLIWILRNPVKRTYSDYWHCVRYGRELLSIQDCWREQEKLGRAYNKGYFKSSLYADQIERFLEHFSLNQMHFIVFEEFIKDPQKGLDDLSRFLEITPTKYTQDRLVSNKGYVPYSIKLAYYTNKLLGRGFLFKCIHFFNKKMGSNYIPIDEKLSDQLYARFEPENKKLEVLLDRDLSCWNRNS